MEQNGPQRTKKNRTLGWLAAVGVAVLVALAVVPVLSGSASASPLLTPAVPQTQQWAYGGQGWSNNSITIGNATATWDAWFGWTVVFTATNTSTDTVLLEEQRTVGISLTATYDGPVIQASYFYHAQEVDTAFVNLTNQSTVYSNGVALPALGVTNVSANVHGAIAEMFNLTFRGHTHSASLTVNGAAQSSVAFTPSLGLIPLNLTGVNSWNSTANAVGAASWNLNWTWVENGLNGTTGSGSGSHGGSVSVTGPVNLAGYEVRVATVFPDHHNRVAIVLVFEGPFDNYDMFVLVPHDFDLFGGVSHPFDSLSYGSASIASGETLYVGFGARGPMIQGATTTFGASDAAVSGTPTPIAGSVSGSVAAASGPSGPGGTVTGYPMTVPAAQAEANCLTGGCSAKSAGSAAEGILLVAVIALAAIAVVGTVGVIEWRSYAARKSRKSLVGGYGESWQNGVPPAGAYQGAPSGPMAPVMGPSGPEEPPRHP
jgi:hypothetical protein